MKKKFVAVIGSGGSGKSTIIRSISGAPIGLKRDFVEDNDTHNSVYVILNSPQEDASMDENTGEFRRILGEVVRNSRCSGIIMAIQPNNPSKRMSMERIFDIVQEIGSFEIFVFVLNPARNSQPADVRDIQNRLAELGVQLQPQLDASRFAYFNARRIQEITGILI
jgi:energy-coupling factor transporter ATP-binding protein EcfA2